MEATTGTTVLVIVISVVGIGVGFLQGIIIYLLSGLKAEQIDIWNRMNNHYHEVSCDRPDCKNLRTGNVIIPRS